MPSPLPEEYERRTWRVWTADLETLRLLYPGRVNEIVRDLLHMHCERWRAQMRGGQKDEQNQGASGTPHI